MVATPASWVFMFDLFDFDKRVVIAQFLNDQHVCVPGEHACEDACVVCEFNFVIEWNKDWYCLCGLQPKNRLRRCQEKDALHLMAVSTSTKSSAMTLWTKGCLVSSSACLGMMSFKWVIVGCSFQAFPRHRLGNLVICYFKFCHDWFHSLPHHYPDFFATFTFTYSAFGCTASMVSVMMVKGMVVQTRKNSFCVPVTLNLKYTDGSSTSL